MRDLILRDHKKRVSARMIAFCRFYQVAVAVVVVVVADCLTHKFAIADAELLSKE